ncbi:MAG: hypothetical protein ACRC1I_24175 [Pseudomonas proteolytica]|uniref:hypothetical protein n=1 Tax=Pseudomonas proteolytica TaxID=219574 RepID=UPI003F3C4350
MKSDGSDSIMKGVRFSAGRGNLFDANFYIDGVDKGRVAFELIDLIFLDNYYFIRLGPRGEPNAKNELTLTGLHFKVGETYKLVDFAENNQEVNASFVLEPDVSHSQQEHSGTLNVAYNEAQGDGSRLIGMYFSYSFKETGSGAVKNISVKCWTLQLLIPPK